MASAAVLDLNIRTVTAVECQDDGGLVLRFDGDERVLDVSGMAAGFTTHDVWWLAQLGGGWDDLEQGWWASVRAVGDAVFIAETDFTASSTCAARRLRA